jgi:hypothetical protein
MKRIVKLVAGVTILVASAATTAVAQDEMGVQSKPFFQPPSFAILPSFLTTNVISAPDGVDSHTAFNARFQAVIPTSSPWLAFVAGAQWGPLDEEDHGAVIFLGGIIPIVPLNQATGGILSFSVDPLLIATGPGSDGMDFFIEGAAVLGLGSMMGVTGYWSGLAAFFLLDQNLTPEEDANGDKDRWNPVLIYGISLPIAPWPGS